MYIGVMVSNGKGNGNYKDYKVHIGVCTRVILGSSLGEGCEWSVLPEVPLDVLRRFRMLLGRLRV